MKAYAMLKIGEAQYVMQLHAPYYQTSLLKKC